MAIEANIVIDAGEDIDLSNLIHLIQQAVSEINGQSTKVNVVEVDNPSSMSPLALNKMRKKI